MLSGYYYSMEKTMVFDPNNCRKTTLNNGKIKNDLQKKAKLTEVCLKGLMFFRAA